MERSVYLGFRLLTTAKVALVGDISVELIPLSDLKARANKYMLELCQSEGHEFPENKWHKVVPNPTHTNTTEMTVITRLHIGHSFITHSFLLKGEQLSMCIGCDERLTIEHILLNCSDFIETRVILQLSHYELYLKIFQWNYL